MDGPLQNVCLLEIKDDFSSCSPYIPLEQVDIMFSVSLFVLSRLTSLILVHAFVVVESIYNTQTENLQMTRPQTDVELLYN